MDIRNAVASLKSAIYSKIHSAYSQGKAAEQSDFWDQYQNNGKRTDYSYAFYALAWNDKIYNPKYPITATGSNGLSSAFAYNTAITNTKVSISVGNTTNMAFYGCTALTTIPSLSIRETTAFPKNTFGNCTSLANITIEGTIGTDISFTACPLTVDSAAFILIALKNYAGTANEFTKTVTLSPDTWALLDAKGTDTPDGNTWRQYVASKGWNC